MALAAVSPCAYAEAGSKIDWNALELTTNQCDSLQTLDSEWKNIYSDLYPQIQSDRAKLRRLMNDPAADDQQVLALQSHLQQSEQRLRSEATRIFMLKKNYLSPEQKRRLYQMMEN
ncbi:MAG: hypothetical protein IPK79_08435 [Vampirovibrionales bacterium]|nr:hypothetical protein [Vampirovibrionales bacterium]